MDRKRVFELKSQHVNDYQHTYGHRAMDQNVDFTCTELNREGGGNFGFEQAPTHQLLVFLEGSCTIDCNDFPQQTFSAGQMVVVCRHSCYTGHTDQYLKMLVISFGNVLYECDKLALHTLCIYKSALRDYDFSPTPIRFPLTELFAQLIQLSQMGLDSDYFHELKHRELFLYLRHFYSKEEFTHLFYELIGASSDFRQTIYENCNKANSIQELIQLLNLSRTIFFQRFRSEFGMSAYQWVLRHRRKQIILAVSDPDARIDDLYEKFGYASRESFHNFCKKEFGRTPKQLIEEYRRPHAVTDALCEPDSLKTPPTAIVCSMP